MRDAGKRRGGDSSARSVASSAVQVHRSPVVRIPQRSRLRPGPRLPRLRRVRRASVLSGQPWRLLSGKVASLQHLPGWSTSTRHASLQQHASRLSAAYFLLLTRCFSGCVICLCTHSRVFNVRILFRHRVNFLSCFILPIMCLRCSIVYIRPG